MNKKDLINAVHDNLGITKKDANLVVTAVIEEIKNGLAKDGKVALVNFGTFEVKGKKAYTARNPQTGDPVDVPAKMVPKFKAGKGLKDAVADFVPADEPETDEPETDEPEVEETDAE